MRSSVTQAGRWWLAAMGIVLIIAGSFFAHRLWLSYEKTAPSRSWPEVPCRIESSRIVTEKLTPTSAPVHRAEIRYRYEVAGAAHVSTRIHLVEKAATAHLEVVQALQRQFPPGSASVCRVNPDDAAHSVLIAGTRAALYTIWFPLLFVAGGLGMLIGAWRQT